MLFADFEVSPTLNSSVVIESEDKKYFQNVNFIGQKVTESVYNYPEQ